MQQEATTNKSNNPSNKYPSQSYKYIKESVSTVSCNFSFNPMYNNDNLKTSTIVNNDFENRNDFYLEKSINKSTNNNGLEINQYKLEDIDLDFLKAIDNAEKNHLESSQNFEMERNNNNFYNSLSSDESSQSYEIDIRAIRDPPILKQAKLEEIYFEDLKSNHTVNKMISNLLKRTIIDKDGTSKLDFTHLLLFGPSGSGKSTRANIILDSLYGSKSWRESTIYSDFKLTINEREVVTQTIQSKYHMEINLNDVGHYYDHYFITSIILYLTKLPSIQGKNIDTNVSLPKFRICIINGVESLSVSAQAALRRVMEKYTHSCKLILVAKSTNGIIDAIKSRCLCIRIPSPSNEEVIKVIEFHSSLRNILIPPHVLDLMSVRSNGNLRKIKLMIDIYNQIISQTQRNYGNLKRNLSNVTTTIQISENDFKYDWEKEIDHISQIIIQHQDIATLSNVRQRLYDLLSSGISPKSILLLLIQNFSKSVLDNNHLLSLQKDGAQTERIMWKSSRPIIHLESFISRFMLEFKKSLETDYDLYDEF